MSDIVSPPESDCRDQVAEKDGSSSERHSTEDIGEELTERINNAMAKNENGAVMSCQDILEQDDWEDYIPEPPDGGWGWVIMIASFFNNFILDGIAYCFGIFIQEYTAYFNSSLASTSLANSLLCGTYLLVGPIVGALVNKYGCRPVGIGGSIIGACAMVLSTLSPTVVVFQLTYGVIGGFGFGMMFLPAVVGVGYYFEKKRGMATGIAVCGTGIGTFCLAPLAKILLEYYDWKDAHLFLAAFLLQGCISSALMRPLPVKKRRIKRQVDVEFKADNKLSPTEDSVNLLPGDPRTANTTKDLHKRNRTISSTSYIAGSKLVVADITSPADNLHASAFLTAHSNANPHISVQDLARPLYRKDIFYSGSVLNVSHIKSGVSLKGYIASVATIPSIQERPTRLKCLNSLPKPMADILAEMLDLTVLRHRGMIILCIANLFGMTGFYVPIIFSSSRAKALGVSDVNAALLLSIIGICNTVGRVLSGSLSLIPSVSPLLVNNICITLCGVTVLLTPFCNTFVLMALACASYGLFASTLISLAPIIMCDLIGLEKLTNGFGLLCLVRGITAIAGPPLEGMLYDWTGDYDATFYAGGACLIASGLLHFLLHLECFKEPSEE